MSINQLLAEEKKKPVKDTSEKANDTPSWMKNIKKKEVSDEKIDETPQQPEWMSKVKKAPALEISFEKKMDQPVEKVETILSPKRDERKSVEKGIEPVTSTKTKLVNATPDWMKNIKKKENGLVEEKPVEQPSWMNKSKKPLGDQEIEELEKKKKEDEIKQKEMEERLRLDREKREKEKKDKEDKIRLKKEEEDRKFDEAQARYQKIHGKQNFGV
jgi:hypothetical protein